MAPLSAPRLLQSDAMRCWVAFCWLRCVELSSAERWAWVGVLQLFAVVSPFDVLCVANVYHLMYPCVITMGRWLNSLIETLFNTPRSFIRIFAFFILTLVLNFIFDSYFWFVRQLQALEIINKLKESVKIYYIAYRIVNIMINYYIHFYLLLLLLFIDFFHLNFK